MAYEVKKTEHAKAKKGKGFWGTESDEFRNDRNSNKRS